MKARYFFVPQIVFCYVNFFGAFKRLGSGPFSGVLLFSALCREEVVGKTIVGVRDDSG